MEMKHVYFISGELVYQFKQVGFFREISCDVEHHVILFWNDGDTFIMTEIVEQKIVSGCKNPFRTFYIAVMHYGVWLLIFLWKMCIRDRREITSAFLVTDDDIIICDPEAEYADVYKRQVFL